MTDTINEMKKSIRKFVEDRFLLKDEFNNYLYMNSLKPSRLKGADFIIKKQKKKINSYKGLSEQMFIHYGCLIYKKGENQEKIEDIFSYFKEVDYLVRNYDQEYIFISEELNILKNESNRILYSKNKKYTRNILDFLKERGQKPLDCLTDLINESEKNDLGKDIYFFHNYVERGFDIAITRTIQSDLYKDNISFIEELNECKDLLNEASFFVNLNFIKDCVTYYRNRDLKIIDKYKFKNRQEFILELSTTLNVLNAFNVGIIYENNIIHNDLIKWLERYKPEGCYKIEMVKDILIKEVPYYKEEDKSIPYLPKSLFRIDEKILKISRYIEALENLSSENSELLQIQEHIAQTIVFGIENLKDEEKDSLINDIQKVLKVYEEMKKKGYGIKNENKLLFEKKIFAIKQLEEAVHYIRSADPISI